MNADLGKNSIRLLWLLLPLIAVLLGYIIYTSDRFQNVPANNSSAITTDQKIQQITE